MKLASVIAALQQIAPEHLAEGWDQVGIHLAGNGKQVRKAMLCIDLTPAVLDEAIANKCQLVVAYHPPIFRPIARLADRDWKERMLAKAVRSGLAVYSPHTSLDAVRNGMNDWLCDGLGAHTVRFSIGVPRETRSHRFKVVVLVPRASAAAVRDAMCEAGAASRTAPDSPSARPSWTRPSVECLNAFPLAHHESPGRLPLSGSTRPRTARRLSSDYTKPSAPVPHFR